MNVEDFRKGKKYFLLDEGIPSIDYPDPRLLKEINDAFEIPFSYTGACLLTPNGKGQVVQWESYLGRCLGGGVFSSRDLDWYEKGMQGDKPGDYVPSKRMFFRSKSPQSLIDNEWIAFEYALMFNLYGSGLVNPWESIQSIEKIRSQGQDWHICINGQFAGAFNSVYGQANKHNIKTLLDIAQAVGIDVRK